MKIKFLPILTIILLLFTSVNIISVSSNPTTNVKILVKNDSVTFTKVTFETKGEYDIANFEEATSFLTDAGKPMLPIYSKTFTFPFGTKIKDVELNLGDISEEIITNKIQPAPKPIQKISYKNVYPKQDYEETIIEDSNVYSSSEKFPDKWYDYRISCGLKDDERVTLLTVNYYPVRYIPSEDALYYIQGADVKITFEEKINPLESADEYDMVIIAPRKFTLKLLPLVNHKNDMGIRTTIKTTESIYRDSILGKYDEYGRDKAERVKYFIKHAIEEWGIKYVLLVGGRYGQLLKWHVPVRYSNLDDGSLTGDVYLSDLYFADIYKNGGEFDDWDSNGNDVFADWYSKYINDEWVTVKDEMDFTPDVYVGRLACRNIFEVGTLVKKIIKYETGSHGTEWFNKMILFGGDTSPNSNNDYEGEIETNHAASFMRPLGFNIVEMWTSNGNLKEPSDVMDAFNEGAGFVFFTGHGSPIIWATHPPNNESWYDLLSTPSMNLFVNKEKLPICVVGGCHNSKFDVAVPNLIKGFLEQGFNFFNTTILNETYGGIWLWEWYFHCWSWNMVRQKNGGSIATIGNTGYGYGTAGPSCITLWDGRITTHFFEVYADLSQQGKHNLGEIHGQTVADYILEFDVNSGQLHRKTIEQWVLLGDPSLRIGGYP